MYAPALDLRQVPVLLRGEPRPIRGWLERWDANRLAFCVVVIVVGTGLFGAAVGSWRAPLQALYTASKLPLVLLITAIGNGLLNALLAPLLGLNLGLRQSLLAVLMSFTIAAAILGAFSPIAAFVVWNTPPLTARTTLVSPEYGALQLTLAAGLAYAGTMGNVRLAPLLRA
jgi:hypothetical protein